MDGMECENEVDGLTSARKHFSKLGGAFILGTLAIYAVQILCVTVIRLLRPEWLEQGDIALMASTLPMYLVGMPILILLVKRIPREPVARHPMKAGQFVLSVIMCYAIVYMSNIVGNIITALVGLLKGKMVQNVLMDVAGSTSLWMIAFYMVLCAPILEEYVFRKLIVDRTVRYGQGVAVLLSGLIFGLFHGNMNQFVYAFGMGVFLAYLYVKTGNIKVTIALHMLVNFVGGFVSTGLMRMVDLEEFERVFTAMEQEAMAAFLQEQMAGILALAVFGLFVVGMTIAGSVLLIVSLVKHKFVLEGGAVTIPKGERFRTVILNLGMLSYCLFWIAVIIVQLFL